MKNKYPRANKANWLNLMDWLESYHIFFDDLGEVAFARLELKRDREFHINRNYFTKNIFQSH